MKIFNFNQFLFESLIDDIKDKFTQADILESIVTNSETLLKSVNAEEVNLINSFSLDVNHFTEYMTLEQLYENIEFNNALKKMKLRKDDKLESTDESETFIEQTIDIKFFLVHGKNESDLEQPKYILFQSRQKGKKWTGIKCYIVRDQIRKFYDKLTNKTIEIEKGGKKYIFSTSNAGNNWIIQKNIDTDNTFKDNLSNDEIKEILKDKNIKITIID